jgi:predicted phage terminase large subunit-like protein
MTSQRLGKKPKKGKTVHSEPKRLVRKSGYGRRKPVNPFSVDLKGALEAPVHIKRSGKSKKLRAQEAMLLRLREKALQGDIRSLERLLKYAKRYNNGSSASARPTTSAQDQAIIASFADTVRAHGPFSRQQPLPGSQAALSSLLRTRFGFFVRKAFATISPGDNYLHNWHIEAIEHQLMMIKAGASRRLLITQPPRSLKSICVSVAYVAWLLGHDPTRRIIVASYSGNFATELHRQFRMVVSSPWYQALFPGTRWERETDAEMITTQGGSRFATSIGGTLTGRGADLIIIDDPLNAADAQSETSRKRVIDWYGGSLVSRLNDKQSGAIVAVMQRLHEDDLAGHLLRQGGWTHLNLPAIATEDQEIPLASGLTLRRKQGDLLRPERESHAILEHIKTQIGSLQFSCQYQQQPIPLEGNVIRRRWFSTYEVLPPTSYQTRIVQSWDVAMTTGPRNDYSVCTTWLLNYRDAYLLHVYRNRLEYPDLRRKVIALAAEYDAKTILIEDAGPGMNLLQDLRSDPKKAMVNPIPIKPEGSKVERMVAQSAKIENGHVYLPKDAPWLGTFLLELLGFPNGANDDQVDSVSQLLFWMQRSGSQQTTFVPPFYVSTPRLIPGQ